MIKNIYQFFDISNAYNVIQFNIFNTLIQNILFPLINNIFNFDRNLNDLYLFNLNIKPFMKDIIILIIIFLIFTIFRPIKL